MKFLISILLIPFLLLVFPQFAFASDISAMPEKVLFGPNDWIKVSIKVDGYAGGPVKWNAVKPDGTTDSGIFENLQASKIVHNIPRNAFDNQFGKWKITYQYNDAVKTIDVEVQTLTISVKTDKTIYFPGDTINVEFTTNFFIPSAANAESLSINVVNQEGNNVKLINNIEIKVYQPTFTQKFYVDDILKYNPPGKYHAIMQYYNVQVDVPFEISNSNIKTSVFLGSDKSLYDPGDPVEINVVIPKLSESSGLLTITFPSGKTMTKNVSIVSSLTRITLNDLTSSEIGTFKYEFRYGANSYTESFDVFTESLDGPEFLNLTIDTSLDKSQYRPGEIISINVVINKPIENQVLYWFEDSLGNQSTQFSFMSTSKTFTIQRVIPTDFSNGPWKVYVKYGNVENFSIFIIADDSKPSASEIKFPEWIRNNAKWWNDDKITDNDFATGIEYMIKEKIILLPNSAKSEMTSEKQIPHWIKNTANWWADGLVSDQEFANAIQYLINVGIIQV